MQKNKTLKQAILAWDGKSAQGIGQVYAQYSGTPDFVAALLSLLDCADCHKGLTWLLKKWLDNGATLSQTQTDQLLAKVHLLTSWESILHVLQSLPSLTISQPYQQPTEQFVRNALAHSNKFVRAWAYNGFYVLAKQYPVYQAEAQALFEMAMRDESASIKARVRQVMRVYCKRS